MNLIERLRHHVLRWDHKLRTIPTWSGEQYAVTIDARDTCARAADVLEAINQLHQPATLTHSDRSEYTVCRTCYTAPWPCPTSRLIHPQEEPK